MTGIEKVVDQKIVVRPWPAFRIGDERFFGYVVGLGVMPDWDGFKHFRWVDFCYNGEYSRYELPRDEELESQLAQYLKANMAFGDDGLYGKVWIRFTRKGYQVDLP